MNEVKVGDRFGRWTVTETGLRLEYKKRRAAARCVCECGTEQAVYLSSLKAGKSRSCGCSKRTGTMSPAFLASRRQPGTPATPGATPPSSKTHGLSAHPNYNRWLGMIHRCTNPRARGFAQYGGRGIQVAPEWRDPATFLRYLDEALGPCPPGHTLDRIDNDGDYRPGNLQWATPVEQRRNQRRVQSAS